MQIPTISPRLWLAFRIASFIFGVTSIALSAASVQITKGVPRPATGDNIFILVANCCGLVTTTYRILAYKAKQKRMSEQGKHRLLPMITESVVIAVLLASFIYGAVSTSTSMGACAPVEAEEEEGDGDDTGGGEVVAGNSGNAGTACALTKGATGLTAGNFITFCASVYTVGQQAYDEARR